MPIRRVLALLVGASLPLLMSSAALAHAVLQPGNAPAGEATEFQVLIPHGCAPGEPPPPPGTEVADTTLVSVEIPDGVTVEGAEEVDGFTLEVTDTEITWSDGVLENEDPGEFFFTAVLDGEDGTEIAFNVFQECTEDLSYRWSGDGDSATPAPVVTVGDEATGGHDHGDDEEGHEDGEAHEEGEGHDMDEMAEGAEDEMAMASEEAHDMDGMVEGEEMADGEMAEADPEATAAEADGAAEEATEEAAAGGHDHGGDDDADAPEGAPATGAGNDGSPLPWLLGGALLAGAGVVGLRRRTA